MKKLKLFFVFTIILTAMVLLLTVSASAEDTVYSGTWGNLTWEFNATTGELVISGEGKMSNFSYDSTSAWRNYQNSIKSVTIGEGVTSIGSYAFYNCSSLTSITIPNSVTFINGAVFRGCSSIESMTLPLVENGDLAGPFPFGFYFGRDDYKGGVKTKQYYLSPLHTTSFETYYIPASLKSVTITGGRIDFGEFSNCTGLTSITLPDSITSISDYAFFGCSGLTSITIPDSITSIGINAFSNCEGLTSITIPDNVTTIYGGVFSGCSGLTSITIPACVFSISANMFSGCTSLTSITIPNSVTSIGYHAFFNCTSLTTITIPARVTSISDDAFIGCADLASITVESGNTVYHSVGNCLIETASKTLMRGCKNSAIPTDGSVTSIGGYAFIGCTGLESITIPTSVTSIGDDAFRGCTDLQSVTFGENSKLTSIGNNAFYGCTGLTSITIPASVTSIGSYAFYNCTELRVVFVLSPTIISALSEAAAMGELIKNAGMICVPANIPALPVYVQNVYTYQKQIPQGGDDYTVLSTQETVCEEYDEEQHKIMGANGAVLYVEHTHSPLKECSTAQHKSECECGHIKELSNHAYNTYRSCDDEWHESVCACGKVKRELHAGVTWEIVKEATTKTAGVREGTCECGYKIKKEIPKLKGGISTGAVIGIVGGSTVAVGGGGFALYWFVFRKKKLI